MRQRTKLILSITLALLCSLIGIGLGANLKGQRDRVAYISFQPSNLDIYLFAQQGKTPKRLTDYQGLDYDPVVSPDGRWLVFCSERRGNPDLYVIDLKRGGTPRLLIDNEQLEDQAAFSADGKFIFFVSTYSGNADVYRMPFRPDRTQSMKNAENLTHHPGADLRPAISPDGRIIAFSSDRELPVTAPAPITRIRSGDIWTLNLIDNTLRRLTHMAGAGWNGSPKWSVDGRQIVFYSSQFGSQFRPPLQIFLRSGQPSRIMIMDADGANAHAVTPWQAAALSPDFLPDGRIIYSRKDKQRDEIVSINTDGAGLRIESDNSDDSYWAPSPGPSPGSFVAYGTGPSEPESSGEYHRGPEEAAIFGNGPVLAAGAPFRRKLPDREIDLYPIRYFTGILNPREDLFLHTTPPNPVEVWAARVDGSQERRILRFESIQPQRIFSAMNWSRDGQWVGFTRGGGPVAKSEADVWKMRADGGAPQNLTPNSPGFDGYPSFSGDGRRIVFTSGRDGSLDIYVMDADGTNVRRLTNDHASNLFPSFSPTSNQIAFISNRDNPKSDVFDVYLLDFDANGIAGKIRRITHDEGQHGHTQYSYDGKWLIFASEAGGINDEQPLAPATQLYGELYAYRIQDGSMIRLTDNKWEEGVPSWEARLRRK